MLFLAAVKIQRLVRAIQAVRRAQLQLLLELDREEERRGRQKQVLDDTVKVDVTHQLERVPVSDLTKDTYLRFSLLYRSGG